jgi:hypothetical protein
MLLSRVGQAWLSDFRLVQDRQSGVVMRQLLSVGRMECGRVGSSMFDGGDGVGPMDEPRLERETGSRSLRYAY